MALFPKKSKEKAVEHGQLEKDIAPLDIERSEPAVGDQEQEPRESPEQLTTEKIEPARPAAAPPTTSAVTQPPPAVKTQQLLKIEQILEEDLGGVYFQLDSQHQHLFQSAGEKTARQIDGLLQQAKVKFEKIFELIKSWLRLVPGINKWFVVQESKIKTDKILRIKNHES